MLTVFISLVLAAIFVVLFLGERRQRGVRGTEQDALMPLTDEDPPEVVRRRNPDNC